MIDRFCCVPCVNVYGLMRFPWFVKLVDLMRNGWRFAFRSFRGAPKTSMSIQLPSQERHPEQYWRRANGLSINGNCEDGLSNMPRQM